MATVEVPYKTLKEKHPKQVEELEKCLLEKGKDPQKMTWIYQWSQIVAPMLETPIVELLRLCGSARVGVLKEDGEKIFQYASDDVEGVQQEMIEFYEELQNLKIPEAYKDYPKLKFQNEYFQKGELLPVLGGYEEKGEKILIVSSNRAKYAIVTSRDSMNKAVDYLLYRKTFNERFFNAKENETFKYQNSTFRKLSQEEIGELIKERVFFGN